MKNKLKTLCVTGAMMTLTGCGSTVPIGAIITDVNLPIVATAVNSEGTKTGEASCVSYLSMVAKGDCSIEAAKKNGKITTVTSVDWHYDTILGIVNNYKVIVHGK
ncbi:MAG: TRL-like protein family [Methyloprofundus sp.]|nr:TRL-like protein family [Methyloprofundus sp.]MBW6453632.1 TRL-like family protein [Methyloprofundus sp.]